MILDLLLKEDNKNLKEKKKIFQGIVQNAFSAATEVQGLHLSMKFGPMKIMEIWTRITLEYTAPVRLNCANLYIIGTPWSPVLFIYLFKIDWMNFQGVNPVSVQRSVLVGLGSGVLFQLCANWRKFTQFSLMAADMCCSSIPHHRSIGK